MCAPRPAHRGHWAATWVSARVGQEGTCALSPGEKERRPSRSGEGEGVCTLESSSSFPFLLGTEFVETKYVTAMDSLVFLTIINFISFTG